MVHFLSGDLSSISGSESDSDSSEECKETTPTNSTHHSPFVYFTSGDSETVYSVYRVTLTGGKVCVCVCACVRV